MAITPIHDELLTAAEVRAVYGFKTGTLAAWRARRIGPPFIQVSGRMPRYSRRAVDAWLASRTISTETDATRGRS